MARAKATGDCDTAAVERLLVPMVRGVVIPTPLQVRATAWAEVKIGK
ncbi:hypothetical protein APY03_3232 [Variovorax sp. WDL1]|nr:hypothetical protein APY03_3232 [Variovorax sp. WDL1]